VQARLHDMMVPEESARPATSLWSFHLSPRNQ
jgi:hypothetical protein